MAQSVCRVNDDDDGDGGDGGGGGGKGNYQPCYSQLVVSILVGRSRGFYQASPNGGLLPQGLHRTFSCKEK